MNFVRPQPSDGLLHHGGGVLQASRQYQIAAEHWLDLSTGINPCGWPLTHALSGMPESVWARLPEADDGLTDAACEYYGCEAILPVAGSQAAIQALPELRLADQGPSRVVVINPGYEEHAYAWQQAGHHVERKSYSELLACVQDASCDVLVLINPNNPSAECFEHTLLRDWSRTLAVRGGWLVVDEAFMDATRAHSLTPQCPSDGLIVLRSLGKFFGLAGLRVGFVCAQNRILKGLQTRLGPWAITGVSRWLAIQALQDRIWQKKTRQNLSIASNRLRELLERYGLAPTGGCALFQWVQTPHATIVYEALARKGILLRYFAQPLGLRFGLPRFELADEHDWQRLEAALHSLALPISPSEPVGRVEAMQALA